MEQTITNPTGALSAVSDYRTGVADNGGEIPYGKTTRRFRANATITRGQCLKWVAPTQTVPLSVTPTVGSEVGGFAGVAATSGSAGDVVTVVVEGYAFAKVGTAATSGGAATLTGSTTGGAATDVTPAAATVAGTIVGTWLAAGTTGNLAPIMVRLV